MESFLNDPDIKESIRRNLMVQKAAKQFLLIDRKIAIEEQKRFSNKITERMRTARAVSQAAKQFNDLVSIFVQHISML